MSEYKPKTKGERIIGEQLKNGVTDPKEISKNTGYKLSTVISYIALYYPTHRIRTRVYEGNNINEKTQQIINLLNKGVCQAQIAREVNVTRQRVNTVRNRYIKESINVKAQERKELATEIFVRVLTLYQGLSKAERETMAFEWKLLSLAEEYGVEVE